MSVLRRLLLPTLTTLGMLAVLIGLGVWQVQRLHWKRGLLAQLDAAEAAPPVPLPFDPKPLQKVQVVGRWMPDLLGYYGAEVRDRPEGRVIGAEALMPLQQDNGTIILVDRGWLPTTRKLPIAASTDPVTVVGWLRPSERPGMFSAPDAPMVRRFYTLDVMAIGNAFGIGALFPYVLVELAQGPVDGFPLPASRIPRPPNDHLGYALTWFALAASLVVIWGLYAWRVVHPRPVPAPRPVTPLPVAEPFAFAPVFPEETAEPVAESTPEPVFPGGPAPAAYARLVARFVRIATIEEASGMLGWDAAAMMPPGGGAARGDQLAVLAGLAHHLLIAPEVAADLDEAAAGDLDPWQRRNLALMRHAQLRAAALPADLVEARERANSVCEKIWREARRTSDFGLVAPALGEVIALTRTQAKAYAEALGLAPYDALMDGYQRGVGVADVDPVFARYEAFLVDALPRAEALQATRPPPVRPPGPFSVAVQEALCRKMAAGAGLEPEHSRLDRSAHPFCGGTPSDVRITTRYDEQDFARALLGVMHETGHALYERGLPASWARQPVGAGAGMAVHESQSLLIEMQACRSDPMLAWFSRELPLFFGGDAAAYAPDNLGRLWRRVARSPIRVDADEMTYPAHVILRFRLEQALIRGDLPVADLPGAWNDGMLGLLDIVPADDARGCLQDIHWYDGSFGYFPSYTLGAMAAAQLMATAWREVADLDGALRRGDFASLLGWLRTRVHGLGSRYDFNDLLVHATGKPLDVADFETHLTARYLA